MTNTQQIHYCTGCHKFTFQEHHQSPSGNYWECIACHATWYYKPPLSICSEKSVYLIVIVHDGGTPCVDIAGFVK